MTDIILYLLGAGASCQALPLASDFSKSLNSFAADFKKEIYKQKQQARNNRKRVDSAWEEPANELQKAVNWLAEETSHHFSVDTFAKKLFLRRDRENLRKLRATLSAYLIAEQARKNVDMRYDSFIASVARFDQKDEYIYLPRHIQILTWNYDTQLEKAFYGFCEDEGTVKNKITFNTNQIRRINGCCGQSYPGNIGNFDKYFCAVWEATQDAGWKAAINLYKEYMSKPLPPFPLSPKAASHGILEPPLIGDDPNIFFAWEHQTLQLARLTNQTPNLPFLSGLEAVSVIIVIGYSFPYFNREIDELIFKKFGGNNLRRVYLQCPERDQNAIKERLKKLLPSFSQPIVQITGTDLFYIPDELD